MIPQPPEVVGVITVRSLKACYLIFFRKEDRRACHEDQLFPERIEAKHVDIGGAGGGILHGVEEAGCDPAETPVRLQRMDDERESEHIFSLFPGMDRIPERHRVRRDHNTKGDKIFFTGNGIDSGYPVDVLGEKGRSQQ